MTFVRRLNSIIAILLLAAPLAWAQKKSSVSKIQTAKIDAKKSAEESKQLAQKAASSREDLIQATKTYKESLEKLLLPLGDREKLIQTSLGKQRQLIEQGLIAKHEIANTEKDLTDIQEKILDTKRRITQADQFVVEIMNLEQMAQDASKKVALAPGVYFDNLRYIRYSGGAIHWSLKGFSQVEFFSRRNMGVRYRSAHLDNRKHTIVWALIHSNSFDVALHPDTADAQVLMSYLRTQGIPFTAFRGPIPGNATGAHIHIGYPSSRIR